MFLRKAQTLHQCRVKEDEAWKKSQVDPVVKQLQAADKRQDRSISKTKPRVRHLINVKEPHFLHL